MDTNAAEAWFNNFYEQVLTGDELSGTAFDEFVYDQMQEIPPGGGSSELHWDVQSLNRLRRAFPELRLTIREVAVLQSTVCVTWGGASQQAEGFLGHPADGPVSLSGGDLVLFSEEGRVRKHSGWIALEPTPPESEPDETGSNDWPLRGTIAKAGNALEDLGGQATGPDTPFGWEVEMDAPRWAVKDDESKGWGPAVLVGAMAAVLALALFLLLAVLAGDNAESLPTGFASDAFAVGIVLTALGLTLVAWRAVGAWRRFSSVKLDLRRTSTGTRVVSQPPPSIETVSTDKDGAETTTKVATQAASTPVAETTGQKQPAPSPKPGPVAREPVVLGSALLAAGILAVGIPTGLSGDEVAAIAAGGAAAIAALVRGQTKPIAKEGA